MPRRLRVASGVISSYANRQNVWGLRYVDDLILRDRDAGGNSATGNLGVSGSGLEERLYALQDPNWNVVAIGDTSGAIQERYCYSAYGTPTFLTSAFAARSPNSSSYSWDSLYTGRQYDPETGLYHYRNRPFGSELGRFIERDPMEYSDSVNIYQYANGVPLNRTDPSGLGCSMCYKGKALIEEYKSDGKIVACIFSVTQDTTNPRNKQQSSTIMPSCYVGHCKPVDFCSDLPPGAETLIMAFSPVKGKCQKPADITPFCKNIVAKDCDDKGVKNCLKMCDDVDRTKSICGLIKDPIQKEICKLAIAGTVEECRAWCQVSQIGIAD